MTQRNKGTTLTHWEPDDEQFWDSEGKRIANRNLWISIPNLLLGFAIWIYWGMVAKYIQKLHFGTDGELFNFTFMNDGKPFEAAAYRALLFTLPAVAGPSRPPCPTSASSSRRSSRGSPWG